MAETQTVPDPLPLMTISVKMPTYWTDSPEVLFIKAEVQFKNKRITGLRTKFTYYVAVLPVVRAPPL